MIVGRNEDLLRDSLVAAKVNWISIAGLPSPIRAQVKIRNKHAAAAATILSPSPDGTVEVRFDQAQRAVTPGQAAVFYGRSGARRRLDPVDGRVLAGAVHPGNPPIASLPRRPLPLTRIHRSFGRRGSEIPSHGPPEPGDRELPDPDSVLAGMWRSIARNLAVFARLPDIDRTSVHQWIRYDGFEHYQAAKARGRGVLFATAHLGNWELSAYAHALLAEPMNVVVRRSIIRTSMRSSRTVARSPAIA